MWQSAGSVRYRKFWLEYDVIKAKDGYEPLYPFDKPIVPFGKPNLPTEFAKVTDLKSALRFERKYAPLNHDLLVSDIDERMGADKMEKVLANPKRRKGGDPVVWVLEHARFVRFALDLIYALAREDGRRALRLYHEFVEYKDYDYPALRGTGDFQYPHGAIIATTMVQAPKSESDALWYAPSVIAILVNANTKNIHQDLMINLRGRIMSVQRYYALIEAIWSMVGDLAMKAQQEEEIAYFKRCRSCNSVFIAKDKRQKFCPPIFGKESLCGLKFRQHKYQANKIR